MIDKKIIDFLNKEVKSRDSYNEISIEKPDPLLVVYDNKEEYSALIASMFAYGRAGLIVKFLKELDFSLLDQKEKKIKKELKSLYYRFQNSEDIINIFITLRRLKQNSSLEDLFYDSYKKENSVIDGIATLIDEIYSINPYRKRGYNFLIGSSNIKLKGGSAYKRWNLFLRWMVRKDKIDLGLWKKIDKKDLIIPLDTHLHSVGTKLGFLTRKQKDLQAAIELTNSLKQLDKDDPTKYDLALYRIGQENIIKNFYKK